MCALLHFATRHQKEAGKQSSGHRRLATRRLTRASQTVSALVLRLARRAVAGLVAVAAAADCRRRSFTLKMDGRQEISGWRQATPRDQEEGSGRSPRKRPSHFAGLRCVALFALAASDFACRPACLPVCPSLDESEESMYSLSRLRVFSISPLCRSCTCRLLVLSSPSHPIAILHTRNLAGSTVLPLGNQGRPPQPAREASRRPVSRIPLTLGAGEPTTLSPSLTLRYRLIYVLAGLSCRRPSSIATICAMNGKGSRSE